MAHAEPGYCEEKLRLMEEFLAAATEVVRTHNDQVQALLDDDPNFTRFEALIQLAADRKQRAKYAYLAHVESHGC